MYAIAIEGEVSKKGLPYYLIKIDGKKHLQIFAPDKTKAIKFSTKQSAEEYILHLPVSAGKKEVVELEI